MSVDKIAVLGVNHKTAPVEVREKLARSGDDESPLPQLKNIAGCTECCFLSTCNRVEILFISSDIERTIQGLREFFFADTTISLQESHQYTYLHYGIDAVHHIYRVGASLDSMIVGEPQILGQLKQAYRDAADIGTTGVILNRLFHKAFSVAKRIRTETGIASSAVSISYAAVQLSKKIFGDLKGRKVLLVGAGEMAELAAEHLITQGIGEVIVANRTLERAINLARRFNGKAVGLNELTSQLELVDILISSTGAEDLILRKEDVRPIMKNRKSRPLFMIDIAVPRDLDPKINDLDNVYLYDIDDLTNVVEVNKSGREREAAKAERIVSEEAFKFQSWLEGMEVTPLIVALRNKGEDIAARELEKTLANLTDLSVKQQKSVENLARSIINKLLHDPILYLKGPISHDNKQEKLAEVRKLFNLDK